MNESELEALYCAIAPRLRRYIGRLCADADDIVQETFFRYLRAGYAASGEEGTKVLFTIATNLARNRWSRARRHEPIDVHVPAPAADPIERLDLIAALGKLAPRDRALIWLAYAEGFDHREVARITGVSRASVRVLLFRAKRKLMKLLEGKK